MTSYRDDGGPARNGTRFQAFGPQPLAARTRVLLDFDGTVTETDTVDRLLERHADPAWLAIEREWESGAIGSRECLARQVACLRATPAELDSTVDSIPIDRGFAALVARCAALGLELVVASDGFDRAVHRVLARLGVALPVRANRLRAVAADRWRLIPRTTGACRTAAAHCKCALVDGRTLLVGDGRSDFCVAGRAALVLAKGRLALHCAERRLPHVAIADLAEAADAIADWHARHLAAPRATGSIACPPSSPRYT